MRPLCLGRHLMVTMLTYIAVRAALTLFWHGVKLMLGIPRFGAVNTTVTALIHVLLLMLLWRLLTALLVRHFGAGANNDIQGSACFAFGAETARLAQSTGLLIGRNPKSGQLLRYSASAHLLNMAPTRSSKGVDILLPNLLTLERSSASTPRGRTRALRPASAIGMGRFMCSIRLA